MEIVTGGRSSCLYNISILIDTIYDMLLHSNITDDEHVFIITLLFSSRLYEVVMYGSFVLQLK